MKSLIKRMIRPKIVYTLSIILLLPIIFKIFVWTMFENGQRKCFLNVTSDMDIIWLPNILSDEQRPKLGQSIFFHETSCLNGLVKLTARQACAIESAAKLNPTWDVYILFASPVGFLNGTTIDPIIAALQSYPNIFMRNVNLWSYADGTPAEKWIKSDELFKSEYVHSHTSDFLRYLSLYKWGGTYLDLDIILKRSINDIEPNYAGAESNEFVAAGIINVDYQSFGHEFAEMCLKEFLQSFSGHDWGNNGPGVITRVLQEICGTNEPTLMTRTKCHGFKVFPINAFYAIGWRNWRYFFDERYTNRALRLLNDSIVIHVWNKHSAKQPIRVGSKCAYGLLADQYCPNVYKSCGEFF